MTSIDAIRGKKVLVTGGLGFIGSNLAHRLVGLDADVVLLDSLISEYGGNPYNIRGIENRIRVCIADVRDSGVIAKELSGIDYLFNLAGQTSHLDSMNDPHTDLEINCRAQLSILEACRKHNPTVKIVFASTRQVYGKPLYLPVDEKHLLQPVDVNGINKMAGEWYHILYNNVHDICACSLRLTNTYGPRMRVKDARQTFLGVWLRMIVEGRPFEVWGGEQLRDFTYVDDAVNALLMAATSSHSRGKVYNLGGECVISLKDLAELAVKVSGTGEYRISSFPPARKRIDIGDYYACYGLIQEELGWQPLVPLAEGLRRSLDYYRSDISHYI